MNVKLACGGGIVGLVLLSQEAMALTYNYGIFSSIEHSNNLAQVQEDNVGGQVEPKPGQTVNAGVDFVLSTEPNATVAANMNGTFSRNQYSLDELKHDDQKLFNASVLYQPTNSNFRLSVFESLTQVAADRTATQTINNTRDINVLNVVPSYFISLTQTSSLIADYRYSKINDRDGDDSRELNVATLGFQSVASTAFTWSVNTRKQNTEFVDTGEVFDQEEVFLGFNVGAGVTVYTLEMGRQRIINDAVSDDYAYQSSVRFSLLRQINSLSAVNLNYRQGYGDLVNIDLDNSLIQASVNDQAAFTDGIVKDNQVNANYTYLNRNLSFLFGVGGSSIEGDDEVLNNPATIDEERYFANISFSNRFAGSGFDPSSFGYSVGYGYQKRKFNLTDEENDIGTVFLRLSYFHSEKLETFFEARSRDSSGTGPGNNFDEKLALVGFRLTPRGRN